MNNKRTKLIMEEKGLKDKLPANRFTSVNVLSESEFSKGIKKAEKGPFNTVQESMTQFESWLKKRSSCIRTVYGRFKIGV
ncbi:hypothetical protein [Gracilimonas halophila]|uniref:Uncharacterized protein n=1 Tax=Gracilimonas halophila TaxID=1834464 RepID=A0ABW5JLE6_9BACT